MPTGCHGYNPSSPTSLSSAKQVHLLQQPEHSFVYEHIIPRNLGGGLVFENASCMRCECTINKEIETPFAEMAGTLRKANHSGQKSR